MTKPLLRRGYKWCSLCESAYPAIYGGCPVHELEKPVTLTRREARLLYDLATAAGYAVTSDFEMQVQSIHAFLAGLHPGPAQRYALAQMILTADGIGWQVIEPPTD